MAFVAFFVGCVDIAAALAQTSSLTLSCCKRAIPCYQVVLVPSIAALHHCPSPLSPHHCRVVTSASHLTLPSPWCWSSPLLRLQSPLLLLPMRCCCLVHPTFNCHRRRHRNHLHVAITVALVPSIAVAVAVVALP